MAPSNLQIGIVLLALVQMTLIMIALLDLVKRKEVKHLPRLVWGTVIILLNFVGPISYLLLGRPRETG